MTKTIKNSGALIVTCTAPYKKVIFTWPTMDECQVVALGASDEEVDALVAARAHEGCDVAGWHVSIE